VAANSGDLLPSTPTMEVDTVDESFEGMNPLTSIRPRTGLLDGNDRPPPHRNASLGISNPSGLPLNSYPAKPLNSVTRISSLLATKSSAKSALPVLLPTSLSPVGTFTSARTPSAAGLRRASDQKLIFAPRYRSPMWSPVQYWLTLGLRSMKLPNVVSFTKI